MKRHTQVILYHLLPAIFWLLAIGGSIGFYFFQRSGLSENEVNGLLWGFLVTALVLTCIVIVKRIKRHESSVEQCFQVAILLGIASYWLPTVLFLTLPVWIYLIYRHLFNLRSFLATLIGYAFIAIWATIGVLMEWIANPWAAFFAKENALGWIPLGASLLAWMASTIAKQNLRVR